MVGMNVPLCPTGAAAWYRHCWFGWSFTKAFGAVVANPKQLFIFSVNKSTIGIEQIKI